MCKDSVLLPLKQPQSFSSNINENATGFIELNNCKKHKIANLLVIIIVNIPRSL